MEPSISVWIAGRIIINRRITVKALNIKPGSTGRHGLLLAAIVILCSNSGCSTIQRHPVLTAVAVGLVAGGIALSSSHGTQSKQTTGFHPLCAPYCAVQ
jgi:hypothetical protein